MGLFADTLDDFEECIRIIDQNLSNKSVLAVILIDSLVDIYSHRHTEMVFRENFNTLNFINVFVNQIQMT